MRIPLAFLALLFVQLQAKPAKRWYDTYDYFVLHHRPGHTHSPQECAKLLDAELVEQVGELTNHWLIRSHKDRRRAIGSPLDTSAHIWHARSTSISDSIASIHHQKLRKRTKRAAIPQQEDEFDRLASSLDIKDPLFKDQWHIYNQEYPEHMMNVTGLWSEGITGKGVISAMVDDGLDYESDDLAANFYAEGSYDFNDHQPLPKPKLWDDKHGTRCAGEIAAVKNDVCGLGLAYGSKVAGVRILSGLISDADEAAALNYGFQETSIYSCSWGPPDDAKSMEGPGMLIQKAVLNGINNGRGGKGSIFVFASGNGAGSGDACNFDGYTNSIYSVTVGAIDYKGMHPYYSEACAANMIVTYSSGAGKHIITTDVGKNTCSDSHGGTSAAAPLAVGVFALALEVRPDLTWRDIQHLCVRAAIQINPDDPDWETTAAGRPYSYKYGYGKLDAYNFVQHAKQWTLTKPQVWIEIPTIELADAKMVDETMIGGEFIKPGGVTSTTKITSAMLQDNNFSKLEHITIKVWISHTRRGDVEVSIRSPNGVTSALASMRKFDDADTGFVGWQFMTLKHWDEDPIGDWTLNVTDQASTSQNGSFLGWSMMLWGSAIDADKAHKFELPDEIPDEDAETQEGEQTKQHPKPTDNLPTDHATHPGETTSVFNKGDETTSSSSEQPSQTRQPAPDEGVFTHMYDLLSNRTWLFTAFGIVVLFGAGAGLFFWRRRQRLRKLSQYTALPGSGGEDVRMLSMDRARTTGGTGTRELYDAFGVVSDEDEPDEETALAPGYGVQRSAGLGYHDEFLDDDGPPTAPPLRGQYRDEPDLPSRPAGDSPRGLAGGRDSPGSGDGSWQDAAVDSRS